jgi:hypothetical protein
MSVNLLLQFSSYENETFIIPYKPAKCCTLLKYNVAPVYSAVFLYTAPMQLFSEAPFQDFENSRKQALLNMIKNYDASAISLEKEAAGFAEDFFMQPVQIDTSKYQKQVYLKFEDDRSIACVEYKIPLAISREEILGHKPSTYIEPPVKVSFQREKELELTFTITTNHTGTDLPKDVLDEVDRKRDEVFMNIQTNVKHLNAQLATFNVSVYGFALGHFREKQRMGLNKGQFTRNKAR